MKPLIIIPVYVNAPGQLNYLQGCLETLRDTSTTAMADDIDIMMVDDASPLEDVSDLLESFATRFGAELVVKTENGGFSKTVNVGLVKAHRENRVAVLVNMDVSFVAPRWLDNALEDEADIVGGMLLYQNKLIQHGGVFFSLLHRQWDHRFRLAPFTLPEANMRFECPVTGALQIIKPSAMEEIGYFDENFSLAYEDVDYCVRADMKGLKVAYNPTVRAYHFESLVRGHGPEAVKHKAMHDQSLMYFMQKHQNTPLQKYVPPIDRRRNENDANTVPATDNHPVQLPS